MRERAGGDGIIHRMLEHAEREGELEEAQGIVGDLATGAYLARFTGDAAETVAEELRKLTAGVDTGGELARLSLGGARGR